MKARHVFGRNNFIAIHKVTLQVLKDTRFPHATALLLEELVSMHGAFNAEWVYRPREVWERDFLITEWNIRCAIDDLKDLGLLLTKRKIAVVDGKSGTYTHFQIQEGRLEELIEAAENAVQQTSESHSTAASVRDSTAASVRDSTAYKEEQENTDRRTLSSSKKPNEEREMSNRQTHAIASSIEKTEKKKLQELLGDKYPYARDLINKHGSKAETVYKWLSGRPALLSAFLTLTDDTFADLISRSITEAGKYVSGWQQNVGAQFFDLLGKRGAMHNSGNNTVASGLVDQDEEFPNPFDFHSFRHIDGLSEMKRAGNFVDTRRYYYRLKESGENPEREAEMKARLERDIAMYGPQSKQAGHDVARENNESISDEQE